MPVYMVMLSRKLDSVMIDMPELHAKASYTKALLQSPTNDDNLLVHVCRSRRLPALERPQALGGRHKRP
jgi:hypothetical protein